MLAITTARLVRVWSVNRCCCCDTSGTPLICCEKAGGRMWGGGLLLAFFTPSFTDVMRGCRHLRVNVRAAWQDGRARGGGERQIRRMISTHPLLLRSPPFRCYKTNQWLRLRCVVPVSICFPVLLFAPIPLKPTVSEPLLLCVPP